MLAAAAYSSPLYSTNASSTFHGASRPHELACELDHVSVFDTSLFVINTTSSPRGKILHQTGTLHSAGMTFYEKPVNSSQWEAGVELV